MKFHFKEVENKLRYASRLLETHSPEEEIIFPGWDYVSGDGKRIIAIRDTAVAIAGNSDPDSGTKVKHRDLAMLLRYVADMLEE